MATPTLGTLELAILLTVSRLGNEAYGLAVRRDLEERTRRDHSIGAIYTTLQRIEDKGLVTSHTSAPLPVRGGRSRRHYVLTAAGAKCLREAERNTLSVWAGVGTKIGSEPA
jgi:DNA-binding PadR family transcriptional regulator